MTSKEINIICDTREKASSVLSELSSLSDNDIKVNVYFEDTYSNKFSSAISIETLTIEDDYDEFIKLINYHTSNNEDCNYNTWLTW